MPAGATRHREREREREMREREKRGERERERERERRERERERERERSKCLLITCWNGFFSPVLSVSVAFTAVVVCQDEQRDGITHGLHVYWEAGTQ